MPFPPLTNEDLEHVLEQTRSLWEHLRGKRLFITGATGFFGIWLLESFAHANEKFGLSAELVGLTRKPEAFLKKVPHIASYQSISLLKGDVRNFDFPAGEFSHVIHAGNPSSVPVSPMEMLETIIEGTRRTLDFAVAAGVKRFLFVSSGAVYGKQPPDMTNIPETYMGGPETMNPSSAYGEGKRVGELLCAIYHQEHRLETTIARCFAFLGPHLQLTSGSAIGNFIGNALKEGPIIIKSDGSSLRSYLYASDLVIWLWTILLKGKSSYVYNVGSQTSISIKEAASVVAESAKPRPKIVISQPRTQGKSGTRYIPNVKRTELELDLKNWISLSEGVERTSHWNKKQ